MAHIEDIVRPDVCAKRKKYEKKSIGASRLYLLVFCFTIIVNEGLLCVDALEHRHRGEFCLLHQLWMHLNPQKPIHLVYSYFLEFIYSIFAFFFMLSFFFVSFVKPNNIKRDSCLTRKVYLNKTNINSTWRHPKSHKGKWEKRRDTIIRDFIFIFIPIPFGEVLHVCCVKEKIMIHAGLASFPRCLARELLINTSTYIKMCLHNLKLEIDQHDLIKFQEFASEFGRKLPIRWLIRFMTPSCLAGCIRKETMSPLVLIHGKPSTWHMKFVAAFFPS